MSGQTTFIQKFLSETALQEIVQLKEPTGYSFEFINCPLLSIDACLGSDPILFLKSHPDPILNLSSQSGWQSGFQFSKFFNGFILNLGSIRIDLNPNFNG